MTKAERIAETAVGLSMAARSALPLLRDPAIRLRQCEPARRKDASGIIAVTE
jgi:hypothetical protein